MEKWHMSVKFQYWIQCLFTHTHKLNCNTHSTNLQQPRCKMKMVHPLSLNNHLNVNLRHTAFKYTVPLPALGPENKLFLLHL